MKRMLWLVSAVVLVVPVVAHAQAVDEKKLDAVMQNALKAFDAPGAAIVVVKDDKVIYTKGFGVRELGKNEPGKPEAAHMHETHDVMQNR